MDKLHFVLEKFDNWLWGNWLAFILLSVGVLYTIITGGVQIRHFGYIMKKSLWEPILSRKTVTPGNEGISSFEALCTAIASCVGSGNIIGVSTAVLAGGLGAIFWMWVAAFLGMATKYGEIILGMLYREKNDKGEYVGGSMYYIEKGLGAKRLAVLSAFLLVTQIVGGNFIQSNAISGVVANNFGIAPLSTGIVLMVCIFITTIGGLKRLAGVAQKLVPFMAGLYVLAGVVIILVRIDRVPYVLSEIFYGAFGLKAMSGGALGAMIMAMQRGVARGLYSNEAGEGTAPVIHSTAKVNHPVQQAMNGVAEVFIDTFIICTITGLVLGVTGALDSGMDGSVLAIYAFGSVWAPLKYIFAISLILFSLTSLMSQWYYGFVGLNYIFGFKVADLFKYVFPLFCVIGSVLKLELVWTIQDIALGLLMIPNLVAMVILAPQVRKTSKEYFKNPSKYENRPKRWI